MNLPSKEAKCHLTGFTKSCLKLVSSGACRRWMTVQGQDPNTGIEMNESRCIDDWVPTLLIENSRMQRETGAAVESFRNEMVALNAPQARELITKPV